MSSLSSSSSPPDPSHLDALYTCCREQFVVPTFGSLGIASPRFAPEDSSIYFCGNSLGLMPKSTRAAICTELDAWGSRAVESHFSHPVAGKTMWMDIDLPLVGLLAPVVGAQNTEVAAMGSLTANLNALLMAFYRPAGRRTKILFEKNAFPSDYYSLVNMAKLHGYDESHLVQLEVAPGETYLRTEQILRAIDEHHAELALVLFPGIQYYTGQWFDIPAITRHARARGITVGWDLAHAVGNVPLHLHDWGIDFAVWCSYKYLNAGPGAIGGVFVHERHTRNNSKHDFTPRLAGWWGTNAAERFKMLEEFDPIKSALSYRQSNPSVIDCVALQASLQVLADAGGVAKLREKSVALTGYLERLLKESGYALGADAPENRVGFRILTPANHDERGCQLSLKFQPHADDASRDAMENVHKYLHGHGIICDERRPCVIRIAPVPLYNTFGEVSVVVTRLIEALRAFETKVNA